LNINVRADLTRLDEVLAVSLVTVNIEIKILNHSEMKLDLLSD
jgi:hypothetical protein